MITQHQLKDMFNYSDGFLIWKTQNGSNYPLIGKRAGGLYGNGYWYIMIDKKPYTAHRLIWLWHFGNLPKSLDHINQIRTDNRVENLRPCTQSENTANRPKQSNNKSGYKGVSWRKDTNCWVVKICLNKKQIHVGHYADLQTAAKAYDQKAKELFGQFAHLNFP